jgi:hypothetical protein
MFAGHAKIGVRGASDAMHCISTLSNVVFPEQVLAWFSKYILKSAADAAQAAIEVWH